MRICFLAALAGAVFATAMALPNRVDAMTLIAPSGVLSAAQCPLGCAERCSDCRRRAPRAGPLVRMAWMPEPLPLLRLLSPVAVLLPQHGSPVGLGVAALLANCPATLLRSANPRTCKLPCERTRQGGEAAPVISPIGLHGARS